jgi:transketolase
MEFTPTEIHMKGMKLMTQEELNLLELRAKEVRVKTIETIGHLGIGHVGGSMSVVDILTLLYYREMNIDPKNPKMEDRDRLVVSKGHSGPTLYAILAMKGFFDESWLKTLNKPGTNLPSHCDMNKTPGVDMTTGSLGQGISAAIGMAMGAKLDKKDLTVYGIIGDGESQEGQIWEGALVGNHHELDNLIMFTDYNKMQIDGTTDEVSTLEPLDKKWESFGWHTQIVKGHCFIDMSEAIARAKATKGKPSMIILDTVKGKGATFCEGKVTSHNMPVTAENIETTKEENKY